MSRWSGKPCSDCGRQKTARRKDMMRCTSCQRKADVAASNRAHGDRILANFGITAADYQALRRYQAGTCAICCRATGASKRLAVDHNHRRPGCAHDPAKGCVECTRGLLCASCNQFIGRNHDNPEVGLRMARYLTDPPWPHVRYATELPFDGGDLR